MAIKKKRFDFFLSGYPTYMLGLTMVDYYFVIFFFNLFFDSKAGRNEVKNMVNEKIEIELEKAIVGAIKQFGADFFKQEIEEAVQKKYLNEI